MGASADSTLGAPDPPFQRTDGLCPWVAADFGLPPERFFLCDGKPGGWSSLLHGANPRYAWRIWLDFASLPPTKPVCIGRHRPGVAGGRPDRIGCRERASAHPD